MRVRNIALFFIGVTLVFGASFSIVSAAQFYVHNVEFFSFPFIPNIGVYVYQTAYRAGDELIFHALVRNPFAEPPVSVSADLSSLGILSTTTEPSIVRGPDYNSDYYYSFGPFIVDESLPNGIKTVSVTAVSADGDVATSTASVAIDNVKPTISLSSATFATTPPGGGDYVYVSGIVDGTGSVAAAGNTRLVLLDANHNQIDSFGSTQYILSLSEAFASSTDGVFSNVPLQLLKTGVPDEVTIAKYLKIDTLVYDEAGNIATTSLTVAIPEPAPPDPCATPGACSSNVLFIPGIKGSILKINDDTVWPPSFWSDDLPELALTDNGESLNPVVVDGILEKFHGAPIYSGFASFMDELVASGTTTEWKALAYDWRFSPERILADGIRTPAGTMDPIGEIEALAASSETGKVTIVAHSMGGLLGKAIIKKLQDMGKENLIDSFVMVGTPQLGTPQAAASLLHGDNEGILAGFIVNSAMARKIAQNFQSTYDLLPSSRYFSEVTEPIIAFDPSASFTQMWREYWGPAIDTYDEFFSFITGGGVMRLDPEFTQLWIPEILRADLVGNAQDFHNVYDTYAFPDSIRVVQIAGWGAPTVKALKYKTRHFMQNYEPLFTIEGDSMVVYPSAVSSVVDETYFFNLATYNALESIPDYQHRSLLNSSPIQQMLTSVIKNESISQTQYVVTAKPITGNLAGQLIVSTHSPVILGAYDQSGRFSGISPNQDLVADVLSITEDIPGSTFLSFGDSQYLFLPRDGSYSIAFRGTGSGPTDVDIDSFANDTATSVATYTDIQVTASTSATFIMNSISPQDSHIQVDLNNDGQVDKYVAPDNQPLTLNELLTNLKTEIQNLAIKDKLKANLIKKIRNIEKKIAKQKNKRASKAVMNLEKQIIKKGKKGRLQDSDVAEILRLLEQIGNAL